MTMLLWFFRFFLRMLLPVLLLVPAVVGMSSESADASVPDIVRKYAPEFIFHPDEDHWPATAGFFIDNSVLKFGGDRGEVDACTRTISGNPDPRKLGNGGYSARKRGPMELLCQTLFTSTYKSNELTRPYNAGRSGLMGGQGFFLDLKDQYKKGYAPPRGASAYSGTKSRIYYYFESGKFIQYWIFFPFSKSVRGLVPVHEGDWEGVTVRLDDENDAKGVVFSQHGKSDPVAWANVKKVDRTHPRVWVAKGSHASFRDAGCNTSVFRSRLDECGNGRGWKSWRSGNGPLTNAKTAPWFGFGGGWGRAGSFGASSGPLGPSKWKVKELSRSIRGASDPEDLTAPELTAPVISLESPGSRRVVWSINASDDVAVKEIRLRVDNGDWRPWFNFTTSAETLLPDRYGPFTLSFQVRDAAGNLSSVRSATVTRSAQVSLNLVQISNKGEVRSCGASEANACSDVVKRFRTSIGSPLSIKSDLLFKAWRKIGSSWVETSSSPFMRSPIDGNTVELSISAKLIGGLWRFQSQVPKSSDGTIGFSTSEYQYLKIS